MADKNIKKSVISKNNLPEFSGETGKYRLRYRVISEDRNRLSHWSKIHDLTVPTVTQLATYDLVVRQVNQGGGVTIHLGELWWIPNSSYLFNTFDVYLATNKAVGEPVVSDYSYYGRVSTPQTSIVFNDTIDNFSIIIHSPTYDKKINSNHILVKTTKHVI
jgi:hypothetical protein